MTKTLLVEVLTEELPPSALSKLGGAFASQLLLGLGDRGLVDSTATASFFATPRRLAARITKVKSRAKDYVDLKKLMPADIAFSSEGTATPPLLKRLEKEAGRIQDVECRVEGGREFAFLKLVVRGVSLLGGLQLSLEGALAKLPTPKRMHYQVFGKRIETVEFVRPVHGLLALHGREIVPVSAFGLQAGRTTKGHRVLSAGSISIDSASSYEKTLREAGKVEPDFSARRMKIKEELERAELELARQAGALPSGRVPIGTRPFVVDTERSDPAAHIFPASVDFELVERAMHYSGGSALLDEVTALVEWPRAYWGYFDERFLELPIECLALTMKKNQKYFPVFDTSAKLKPYFVVISNNDGSLSGKKKSSMARNIVAGNERVLRPRLADAHFFYKQDKKSHLEERVPNLARVVFHNKLGSQLERTHRIVRLATAIAGQLQANVDFAARAALLSKADLLTEMVGEFPELQGVMGRYYALNDGENEIVANALESHYRPRFAGDKLPKGHVACAVALADKFDAIAGLFGIGEQPTGEKDPFGLRRAALGIIRIIVEHQLPLSLHFLVNEAFRGYPPTIGQAHTDVQIFILSRFEGYLKDQGGSTLQVDSVLSMHPTQLSVVPRQLQAVKAFQALPEAESLAAANKRVANILRQAEAKGESYKNAELEYLKEPAERTLFKALQDTSRKANELFESGDYAGYLKTFAVLKSPVDAFFDSVQVMADDAALRHNRLALLQDLRDAMNRVADISKLAVEK